jgi:ABC-2 type transport system permease protein
MSTRALMIPQRLTPVIETMRGLWMGGTSTGAPVGHEAMVMVPYCVAILAVSAFAAARLFSERSGG